MSKTQEVLNRRKVYVNFQPQEIDAVPSSIDITELVSRELNMNSLVVPCSATVSNSLTDDVYYTIIELGELNSKVRFAHERIENILDASIVNDKQKKALREMLFEVVNRFGERPW